MEPSSIIVFEANILTFNYLTKVKILLVFFGVAKIKSIIKLSSNLFRYAIKVGDFVI